MPSHNQPATLWINGELVDSSSPALYAGDPGFLVGLGVFETLTLRAGVPLCFSRHYQRLQTGATTIGIATPPCQKLRDAVLKTAAANGLSDARIRITVSGEPSDPVPPTTLISAVPLVVPDKPANAISLPFRRNPTSPISGIKSTSYAENILALRLAKSRGADEAILCDSSGNLSEASSSNLFFVRGGKLHTPPISTGCLPGITRGLIVELCEKNGLPLVVDPTPPCALEGADEAFLTSSIRGVHPLASLDGKPFPSVPGALTSEIARWLDSLLSISPDP